MRQVMVVDDERWIRRGLIGAIPWEELGLTFAGEAEDGEDAYHMALRLKPELMFLDMRMPGLDGRELLRLLSAELPELITIVVSGYSDFEYTKEAIKHNAFDYLLKPLKKEELYAVLNKALAELERRERIRNGSEQLELRNWLWRELFAVDAGVDGEVSDAGHGGMAVRADGTAAGWLAAKGLLLVAWPDRYTEDCERHAVTERLQRLLEQERAFYFGGAWSLHVTSAPASRGELVLCLVSESLDGRGLERLIAKLQAAVRELTGTSYSVGHAGQPEPIARLPKQYRRIKQALGGKRLGEAEAIVRCGEPARREDEGRGRVPDNVAFGQADEPAAALRQDDPLLRTSAAAYPREAEQALLMQLQLGNRNASLEAFDRWFAAAAGDDATVDEMRRYAAMLVHALEKQLQESGSSLGERCGKSLLACTEHIGVRQDRWSIRQLLAEELLPSLLSSGAAQAPGSSGQGEQVVRDIQRLIQLHYAQPLSLHQLAEGRFMNAEYVSRLFKKMTGSNFVDYLTDYRIAKAMELMQSSACKNYEIAKRVGYEDYRYFSQIFKKKTGMTIGEYRSGLEMKQ